MTLFILILLGLIVGSFLNVVILRLPFDEDFVSGRSRCAYCHRDIAWYDLFPLISFAVLGGACRYCHHRLSWQYPIIEAASASLFVVSYWVLANHGLAHWVFSLLLLESFLVLAVIDLKHLILPDSVMLFILGSGLGYGILESADLIPKTYSVLSVDHFATAIIASGTVYLLWLYSEGRWIGFGDVKLLGLLGILFGVGMIGIVYGAVLSGALIGIILVIAKRAGRRTALPFGTFLGLSASVYILFGQSLVDHIPFISTLANFYK